MPFAPARMTMSIDDHFQKICQSITRLMQFYIDSLTFVGQKYYGSFIDLRRLKLWGSIIVEGAFGMGLYETGFQELLFIVKFLLPSWVPQVQASACQVW